MNRLKYILIMTLLTITTLVTAQESYVIDSVCVDGERIYRRDGEKSYTYDWSVTDTLDNPVDNPTGVPFVEIEGTDTTWGSEITYQWLDVGEFDIVVLVYSEHGCDTIEQGRVKVFEPPIADAGPDVIVCSFADIELSADTAWNYSAVSWASLGDGTFSNSNLFHPTYYLGPDDNLNGNITLVLTAFGLAENITCNPDNDSVTYFFSKPDIAFSVVELICYNDMNAKIDAFVTDGRRPYKYEWTGPNGFVATGDSMISDLGAGKYVLTVTDANLCTDIDSVEIVNPPELLLSVDSIQHLTCYGYSDGFILASAVGGTGKYKFTLTGPSGFFAINDSVYNLYAGTYVITVVDANGCVDSETVVIEEPDPFIAQITPRDTFICEGDEINLFGSSIGAIGSITHYWLGNGAIYLSTTNTENTTFSNAPAGIYKLIYAITDASNCEASDSIEITVYPPSYSFDSMEICMGDAPLTWNNNIVISDRDSTYLDTLMNSHGCDSLLTLEVKILFPDYYAETLSFCENDEPFTMFNHLILPDRDSIYFDTLQYTVSGCDSLFITLNVFTLPVTDTLLDTTLCAGAPTYAWNSHTIITQHDSIYLDTLINTFGCDSLLTYNVFIIPPDTLNVDTIMCQDEPEFAWNGLTIFTKIDSTYEAILKNSYGCDSLVNLNVTIIPTSKTIIDSMICIGEPAFAWNSHLVISDSDSTYLDTLVNAAGCDSLLTLNVNIIYPDTVNIDTVLCEGTEDFVWNSHNITDSQDSVYSETLQNIYGCDSLLTLNVTVFPLSYSDSIAFICEGVTVADWNGQTILNDQDSIYLATLTNQFGCDSLLTLDVTVLPEIKITLDTTICASDAPFTWYGKDYNATDFYYDTLLSATVCDTLLELNLLINSGILAIDTITACELFTWTKPNGVDTIINTSGIYDYIAISVNGCGDTLQLNLIISPDIILDTLVTHLNFSGGNDGSINLTVSGGIGTFIYEWEKDGSPLSATTEDLYDLVAGIYKVVVTDAVGCTDSITVEITEPDLPPPDPYLDCPDIIFVGCYDEIAAYPPYSSYLDYVNAGGIATGSCGIDTSTFNFESEFTVDSTWCKTILRTYSIVDSCGTIVYCEHLLVVDDTEAPVVTCPPNDTVVNTSAPIPFVDYTEFVTAGGIATDNCEIIESSFNFAGDNSDGKINPEKITRTYEIADSCGNIGFCTQTIVIYATSDVYISIANLSFSCPEDVPLAHQTHAAFISAGGQTHSDDPYIVDPSSFKFEGEVADGNSCPATITRTYSIKNNNGDYAKWDQIIVVNDVERPTFKLHTRNVSCNARFPIYDKVSDIPKRNGTVNDNCGVDKLSLTLLSDKTTGNCPHTITRVYRVTDMCGNSRDATEIRIFHDDDPPQFVRGIPDIDDGGCVLPDTLNSYRDFQDLRGEYFDLCGSVRMTHLFDTLANPTISGVYNRIYRFFDNCDNYVDYIQKITIDIKVPVFTQLGPFCQNTVADVLPTTSDNGITGTWNPATIETSAADISTYTFTPDAGQCAGEVTMVIEITPEIILTETHVNIGFSNSPIGSIDIVVSGGTNPFVVSWSSGETTEDISNLSEGTYTVTVIDIMGCEASLAITITANEAKTTVKPIVDTIECITEIPAIYNRLAQFIGNGGDATSDCGIDLSSFKMVKDSSDNNSCPETIYRIYSISDNCGHTLRLLHKIVINDITPPQIICPPNESAECLSDLTHDFATIEEFIAAGGSVSDNCALDSATFAYSTTIIKTINSTEMTTVYSIADLCGNIDSCEHKFILTDTIPPTAICNSITVYLDDSGNYILTDIDIQKISAGSNDNCTAEEDLIIDVDIVTFDCDDVETGVQVIIVVTDEAGNYDNCTAIIIVVDSTPPVALCRDIIIYLDEYGLATIDVSNIDDGSYDNCKLDTMFISKDTFDCSNVGDNPVQLTVIDAATNRDSCTANVIVVDTIPPDVIARDLEIQLDANAQYTLTTAELIIGAAYDICGVDTVFLDLYELDCDNIGITYVVVTAIDVNGNVGSDIAELTVYGNIAPTILPDSGVTVMNVAIEIDIVSNDYDLKTRIDISTLSIFAQPAHGTIETDLITGYITYTPAIDFVGTDVLTYSICDDAIPCEAMCGKAQVFITVIEPNNPPTAVDDYFTTTCANPTGNIIENDYDIDIGDEIKIIVIPVEQPAHGDVIIYDDGDFYYIADIDYIGLDSFKYEIIDNGIPNLRDTATVYIAVEPDNDCDGVPDWDDIDDDNDGIRDIYEGDMMVDSDLDGIPDSYDIDSDNDGIVDNIEGQAGNWDVYVEPSGLDENGDGWDDAYDPNYGGYDFDLELADTDGDFVPDFLDLDSENDHVFDFIEGHDLNADGIPDVSRIFVDSDRDGLDDIYDTVFGWNDPNDPFNSLGSNAPLQDFDGDGIRDWRDANDENDEYMTIDEDLNNDGDYSNDDLDLDGYPEYLDKTLDCELFVPEGFSPNGDGVHDFFQVLCIQRYPNAIMMIFNRNGDKLFEKDHYGNLDFWGSNEDAWWWGNSENKWTIFNTGGLPAGNYVYVLQLGNGKVVKGTVMINY